MSTMKRAERKLWAAATALPQLGELTAQWLEGRIVEVLATGARLEQDAAAGRWAYAAQGAVAGLPLRVIAAALGADPHRVVDQVARWADEQVRSAGMSPERHVEILRLIGGQP